MGWMILKAFLAGPLDRIMSTIDKRVDSEAERERIKAETVQAYVAAQTATLTSRWGWAPLLFYIPLAFWFASVCVYSALFCRACIYPVAWSVAALPPSLDPWIGPIIGSLFIGRVGEQIIAKWRSK